MKKFFKSSLGKSIIILMSIMLIILLIEFLFWVASDDENKMVSNKNHIIEIV